jgi:hypothetical protein
MSVFKSLAFKVQQKKEELEREAAKKAAQKAAELALSRGKEVARAAVAQAGQTLKTAGAVLEEKLFGPDREDAPRDRDEPAPAAAPRPRAEPPRRAAPPPDPERFEREVDEELAALKRKLAAGEPHRR